MAVAVNGFCVGLWVWRAAVALFAVLGSIIVLVSTFLFNYETANPLNACSNGYWTIALTFSGLNILMIALYFITAAWTLVDPKPIVDFVLRYITPVIHLVFTDSVVLTANKVATPDESKPVELQSLVPEERFPAPPSAEAWNKRVHRVAQYTYIIVSAVLVILCLLVFVFNILTIASSLGFALFKNQYDVPQSGEFTFAGLSAPVRVSRDSAGVVHIRAADRHDASFAQAVVHAQERLFQMEFYRRLGSGRLAEVLGEDALDYDKLMVTMGFYDSCGTIYDHLEQDSQEALTAYVEGVNAWLDTKPRLPLEFSLIGLSELAPWTVNDSLVYSKLMSLDLSGNMNDELVRYSLLVDQGLSPERIEQLFRQFPDDANPTILSEDDITDSVLPTKTLADEIAEAETRQAELDRLRNIQANAQQTLKRILQQNARKPGWATQYKDPYNLGFFSDQRRPPSQSNNWVIHGSLTASGRPILADDPHLRFSAPMIWFLMHIETTDDPLYNINVTGATVPTLPGVVIGRNDKIAWGVTNSGIDVQDVFVLQVNNQSQYYHDGGWKQFEFKNTTIKVKDKKDVKLSIRQCVYGPVFSDGLDTPGNEPMALRWTSLDPDDTLLDSYTRINKASNWNEFRAAMDRYTAPIQNFVYADVSGNIGYIAAGRVPIRAANHTGKYPAPGNGDFDWTGLYVPINELPFVLNPASGYIVTANGKITPNSYKHNLGYDFDSGYRQRRIVELIQSYVPSITVANVKAMQHDQTLALWDDVKIVFERMNATGASTRLSVNAYNWLKKLLKWDGNMHKSVGSQEASIFETWYQLMTELPYNETGIDNWDDSTFILTILNATGYQNQDVYGFDEAHYDPVCHFTDTTSCLVVAEKMLENAVRKWGRDIPKWGTDVHHAFFGNTVIGSSKQLGCLGNRQMSMGGNSRTVNPAAVRGLDEDLELRTTSGASYREIIDLSDMEKSLFITPMGPTGNVLEKTRYERWLKGWADGEYLPMQLVPTTNSSVMTLVKP